MDGVTDSETAGSGPLPSLAGTGKTRHSREMPQLGEPHVPSLIERLKKKKVVQWTLGYLAGAFVVLQLMDALEGALNLSQQAQQSILALLSTGLVMTAIVAWFHGDKGSQRVRPTEIIALAITLVLGIAASAMLWVGTDKTSAPGTSAETASGSVLSPAAKVEETATPSASDSISIPRGETSTAAPDPASRAERQDVPPATERTPLPTLTPESPTLFAGDSVRLELSSDQPAFWTTSDGSVARVMSDGLVLAIGPGSARITADVGEAQVSTLLTVRAVTATEVDIGPVGPMQPGESVRPEVVVLMANGQVRGRTGLEWSSSDPSVVQIGNRGTLSAFDPGSARISAEMDGVTGSIEVVVEAEPEALPPTQPISPDVLFSVLESYREALQGQDMEGVTAIYPGISPEERAGWETLFGLGELSVEFSALTVLEASGTTAEVEFEQTLSGNRIQQNVTRFVASLTSEGNNWRIQRLSAIGSQG